MRAVARTRRTAGIATLALVAACLATGPASAAPRFTFEARLGDPCLAGTGPADASLTVTLSRGGTVRQTMLTDTETDGVWFGCFDAGMVRVGDVIRATDGAVARWWTVPNLTIVTDRATDIASGKAPRGGIRWLYALSCAGFGSCGAYSTPIAVTGSGGWSVDLASHMDLRGGDDLQLEWLSASGDSLIGRAEVPYLRVWGQHGTVSGVGVPKQPVTVTLRTSAGTVRATAHATASGQDATFSGTFKNTAGVTVVPVVGDRITADLASDATMLWSAITVKASAATDIVSGSCTPWSWVRAMVVADAMRVTRDRHLTSSGSYSIQFGSDADIAAGDQLSVTCRLATGDLRYRESTAGD